VKVGLFFGSFNPIHTGHLVIAEYILEFSDLDEVWFVVSPQNPFKVNGDLVKDTDRLAMVKLAIPENEPRIKLCSIEMDMPRPSFTIDTLKRLKTENTQTQFVVIMGSDTEKSLSKWKNYDELISNFDFYIYPREATAYIEKFPNEHFSLIDAPILGISSTQIRELIQKGCNVSGYVPDDVWDYIVKNKLFGYSGVHNYDYE